MHGVESELTEQFFFPTFNLSKSIELTMTETQSECVGYLNLKLL